MSAQNIIDTPNQQESTQGVNPKKFLLWLFIVAIIMLFAAFTSGYIVRRAEGNWMKFPLPASMWINTIIILVSSIPMIWAYRAAKRNELSKVKTGLIVTFILGLLFMGGQLVTFYDLVDMGVYFSGSNVAGSFLIIIAFVHAVHIIGGLIWLLIVLAQSYQGKVNSTNILNINLCNTYWHFIGILWVYLILFFYLYR